MVFRDFFLNRRSGKVVDDGAAEAQTDDTETDEFNIGYWFLIYCIFLALHLINTIFIYQKMIGKRVKNMTGDEKVYDLPRLRWIAAIFITMITPICAVLLHRDEESAKLLKGSWWLGWVSAATYTLICFFYYNVDFESSSRKDALIPTKRHSVYLFILVIPMVVLFEIFLTNEKLLQSH